ncbi:carbohydrate ABC transporter permease [Mesorhizobium sp. L-8-3]|uniref:carbohydrate ABC transporter permease n=1 Tax=Mesorhizobium sp. L-8-3 TaxID=2744522 RepID=UPI001937B39C|nr:sugar ABC transporter permease [Mesorhizobium sp. L-8-3]BCH27892.1 glycerol-3-phosphate transporter permease [Mesorhizobium sp. L-8-3]
MKGGFYKHRWLPLWLSLPQILIMVLFFFIPIGMALFWSFSLEQPFGGGSRFVGWQNYARVFHDQAFWLALGRTAVFMVVGTTLSVGTALIIAFAADRAVRLSSLTRNLMMWPKAISAATLGVIFIFILDPYQGAMIWVNQLVPGLWNPRLDPVDTWIMLFIANTWNGLTLTFIILLAGLQGIPDNLHKAAAIDGAGPWRRLFDIQLPLITPQLFIVVVLEVADSIVSSFNLIEVMTKGGPGDATYLLVYKIYRDGFGAYDLSGAATQTAILMVVVVAVTSLQYLILERRVEYDR